MFVLGLLLVPVPCDLCGNDLLEDAMVASRGEELWCLSCAHQELLAQTDERVSDLPSTDVTDGESAFVES